MPPVTPALRLLGSRSGSWETRLENPKAIAAALGPNVLAAFYKCFVALDRIQAIEHLILITNEHSRTEAGADDVVHHNRSPSVERDFHFLMLMIAGTMYELGNALQQLVSTKVVMGLKDRSAWEPLGAMSKRWQRDPMASKMRNGFAHHLGELDAYARGIANSRDTVVLETGRTLRQGESRFVAPLDALLFGEAIEDERLEPFLERMSADHRALADHLHRFFATVLREHGIALINDVTD